MRSLDKSLPLKLLKAREQVMERFRPHLNSYGVTEQQWRVIRALAETGEIETYDLAERIVLRMPSLSRMLPDLEGRGLVKRRKSSSDGRLVLVQLTRKGQRLFADMSAESEAIYGEIKRTLGAGRLADLMRQLDALIRSLKP